MNHCHHLVRDDGGALLACAIRLEYPEKRFKDIYFSSKQRPPFTGSTKARLKPGFKEKSWSPRAFNTATTGATVGYEEKVFV